MIDDDGFCDFFQLFHLEFILFIQRFSKPTHEDRSIENFPSVQLNAINYLHIGNDGLKLDSQPRKEAIEFWNKLQQTSAKAHTEESEQSRDEL